MNPDPGLDPVDLDMLPELLKRFGGHMSDHHEHDTWRILTLLL